MSQAGGEKTVLQRQSRILLDHQAQFRQCLIETPTDEICGAEIGMRPAGAGPGAEAQRGIEMLDRDIRLPRPEPQDPAKVPAARQFGLSTSARSTNAIMAPMSSPK
jgi:hypothetical protein